MNEFSIVVVTKYNCKDLFDNAEFKEDENLIRQFKTCDNFTCEINGEYDNEYTRTKCAALVNKEKNQAVGFVVYKVCVEDYESSISILVNVEYVYLPDYLRNKNLQNGYKYSNLFIDHIGKALRHWIPNIEKKFNMVNKELCHASSEIDHCGKFFVKRLNESLKKISNEKNIKFI